MIYNTTPLYNYQFVSVQVNSLQSRYYFPDLPNLRDVKTYSISAYQEGFLPKDINNVPVINFLDFGQAFITLYANNREVFQRLDIQYFTTIIGYNPLSNAKGNYGGALPIDYLKIDFSKSFIEFPSGATPTTPTPFVIPFGIYYIK